MRYIHYDRNELKTKTKFLFFPKRIWDETRWLEIATWNEKHLYDGVFYTWQPIEWVNV